MGKVRRFTIRKDITNQKFGMLTTIKHIKDDIWLFSCDCGGQIQTSRSRVVVGSVKSCGCLNHAKIPRHNIAGMEFGKLTAICYADKKWKCVCECGNMVYRTYTRLVTSKLPSCGCSKLAPGNVKHGGYGTPEYSTWAAMKERCCNPNNHRYKDYGGRGIKICERWLNSFENFLEDMGRRPSQKYSLDRIDVNGNYEPSNCRWATTRQQCNNTRVNKRLTFREETHTMSEWSDLLGICAGTIRGRYSRGLPIEDVLSIELLPKKRRAFTDEEVRFIRESNLNYTECKAIVGKRLTYSSYKQIVERTSYKDII